MVNISAVIITFNEQMNIARCIASIKPVADEILVVDSFSTDDTKKICLELGVKFLEHRFEGYAQQKNWANAQASYSNILSVDADEMLSEELTRSILEVKNTWPADGYSFNRLNNYCGQWIKHGGWYPDKKIRLWNRNKGSWEGPNPHEKMVMHADAKVIHLKGDLLHYTAESVNDHFNILIKYAWMAANNDYRKGRKSSALKMHFIPTMKFLRLYIFRLGFLDGFYGYVIAKTSAFTTKLRFIYLRDMHRRKNDSI